jgi:hypothetical protein
MRMLYQLYVKLFAVILLLGIPCSAQFTVNVPPKISIQIPDGEAVEGRQTSLTIVIDHSAIEKVDISSFRLDKKPLTVELIQQETVSPEGLPPGPEGEELVVDRYRAVLPAKSSGIYTIGPITVTIGTFPYSSNTIALHVRAAVTSENFRLTAKIDAPPNIFPGQVVNFQYQIFFVGSMQLLREDLPLLNVPGFVTVGSPTMTTESSGQGNVQTITQQARATTPGSAEAGQSIIEGMAVDASSGTPRLIPPLYRAKAPSLTVAIKPFPTEGRPTTFDGALGSFVWRVETQNGIKINVGESVDIAYCVSGRGDLSTVRFPTFDRIPGLIESFWTEGDPPAGEEVDGTKRFVLSIRPKKVGLAEIPGFFFSSFDPYSQQYVTVTVPPVSINVLGSATQETSVAQKKPTPSGGISAPFELSPTSVHTRTIPPLFIVIACGGALALGIAQWLLVRALRNRKGERPATSRDLFYKAVMNRSKRETGLQFLKQALYIRLFELNLTATLVDTPEAITGEGLVAEVRALLKTIDQQLYRGSEETSPLEEIYSEASALYYRLKHMEPR